MKIFPSQGFTEVKCLNMVCYPWVCPTIPTMNHYGCLAQLSLPKPVGTPCSSLYFIISPFENTQFVWHSNLFFWVGVGSEFFLEFSVFKECLEPKKCMYNKVGEEKMDSCCFFKIIISFLFDTIIAEWMMYTVRKTWCDFVNCSVIKKKIVASNIYNK